MNHSRNLPLVWNRGQTGLVWFAQEDICISCDVLILIVHSHYLEQRSVCITLSMSSCIIVCKFF
jgi:hypothetical protein